MRIPREVVGNSMSKLNVEMENFIWNLGVGPFSSILVQIWLKRRSFTNLEDFDTPTKKVEVPRVNTRRNLEYHGAIPQEIYKDATAINENFLKNKYAIGTYLRWIHNTKLLTNVPRRIDLLSKVFPYTQEKQDQTRPTF